MDGPFVDVDGTSDPTVNERRRTEILGDESGFFSRHFFTHEGLEVEQRIYHFEKEGFYKLCWSLKPFEKILIGERGAEIPNPIVHNNYSLAYDVATKTYDTTPKELALRRVREQFEQFHGLRPEVWGLDRKGKIGSEKLVIGGVSR